MKNSICKSFSSKIARIFSVKARRAARDKKDIEYINANADRMNAEMAETLEFQADIYQKFQK